MVGGANNAINASLYRNLPFVFDRDLVPVAFIGISQNVMVVSSSSPPKTAQEFLAQARQRGQPITFASSGAGSSLHLTGEMFKSATQLPMVHVPYKGSSPALVDVMSGQVDVMFDSVITSAPLIKQQRLRALAVTGTARSAVLPEVPTLKESGINVEAVSFVAIYAPAGTPIPVLERLNREIRRANQQTDVLQKLEQLGIEPRDFSLEQANAFNKLQVTTWREAVHASGARAE